MCLIVLAWKVIPGMPLVVASNRDEFYARPSSAAGWWEDQPDIYAGRDLQDGGTWMGVTREGRFAALTNFRGESEHRTDAPSRGALVAAYLSGTATPQDYLQEIAAEADRYNGFNLLLGDRSSLFWYSNRGEGDARNGRPLETGVYGLSNALLDTPWPKVTRAKAQFASLLCQGAPPETYFEMLGDTTRASDCRLPDTGIGIDRERMLSSVFILSSDYGTRASTLLCVPAVGLPSLIEQTIDPLAPEYQILPTTDRHTTTTCKMKVDYR
ncbi:NRDE family protein [Herbaspirillum sp. RTI4]|uniref:NRDE family protein n=1 Tax=Herbaspirillum sp. RTI4 TaxID=3048640 RepID=UPI002AB445E3|nr:NRDE family protein [Herbaspirillum sp. RTI4]MDY7579091.1 NRDE family protein [Herbaspirillum sp. RTI4]MEA9981330.1 NRDE family protein [Herbaspirillum sp. RTI4]